MKLVIGGSPCTKWSIAQTKGRETEPSGIGWELFENYRIALKKYKPNYFLYENNKSMSWAIRDQITRELGVEPIMIDSALVSGQTRKRLYWTNIPGVRQPNDLGIMLMDVLDTSVSFKEKGYALDSVILSDSTDSSGPIRVGTIESKAKTKGFDSQQYRVYSPYGKSVTLCGNGEGVGAKTGLYLVPVGDDYTGKWPVYEFKGEKCCVRKLTVTECKRLQTVPEDYIFPVSDTQAYKMLGNGWTVDVIVNILSYAPGITEEPLEVLSMYDGMSCGQIALDKLGARIDRYYATEIDKYAIKTTQTNFPDTIQLGDAFQVRQDGWLEGVIK